MLAIRLQRHGRKGYPVYRLVVQDSKRHPSSGRIVASVGRYNPHSKETVIDKEKVEYYLSNGAQPSERVVKLLTEAGIKMPSWVKPVKADKAGKIRNPEKLRKNQPKEEVVEEATEAEANEEATVEEDSTEE